MKKYLNIFIISLILGACSSSENPSENNENETIIVTASIINIDQVTSNQARVNASVSATGTTILERGVCWNTSSNPTLLNNSIASGTGTGNFSVNLSTLSQNTNYYVRAYAITEDGTKYSSNEQFNTLTDLSSDIFDGNVQLSSQAEVNNFGANNYTEISGVLYIEGGSSITDLTPLNSLEVIGSEIRISGNTNLQNLNGLDKITYVGSRLAIYDNPLLTNLQGLNGLETVQSQIEIGDNNQLTNINGLESLTHSGGLSIYENPLLENLNALSNLTMANGIVTIRSNPLLSSLNGLNNLEVIESSLIVENNDLLVNLSNLSSLRSVGHDLSIIFNDNLTNIQGLNNLKSITYQLRLYDNALTAIDGFASLETVGEVNISFEDIVHMDGFDSISSIGNIHLEGNDLLTNLNGFETLLTVENDIVIESHDVLTDFCGLKYLFENNGLLGDYKVQFNVYNPSINDILDGNCTQ